MRRILRPGAVTLRGEALGDRDQQRLLILGDALEDAGEDSAEIRERELLAGLLHGDRLLSRKPAYHERPIPRASDI